ncbi:unnamed protein product [Paramecium sonneborni]|uniref:Transmembrane protein n=1 Tax=Paramecium sonneborni TaxID=65129 RepID=A0A8S1NH95_9CILI|nr:unnamed protein product [Paramecium sonneborni]
MERINSYLKACDIFAQSPSLGMNHQSAYQSSFGGFTSITTIFLVFLFFSTNFLDYLEGKNIITKQTQVYDNDLSNLQLDDEDFIIALGIEQSNFLSQPYFSVTLQQREYERLDNGSIKKNITQLPLEPCTPERFQKVFQKYGKNFSEDFNHLKLENLLCPKINISMNIGGTFASNYFNFLKIDVAPCNQSLISENSTCASNDILQNQLNKTGAFKVQVYLINKVINPNKIGSDYISVFLDDSSYLSFVPKKLNKYANIYFREYKFKNNLDFYPFNDNQKLNFISIDNTETKEVIDLGTDSDSSFAAFYLRKSPIIISVERNNQSVSDLLSKLGGLLQISLIVMGFIIAAYNKQTMMVELSNKIYEFILDVDEQNKQHQLNLELINNVYEDRQFRHEYYINKEGQQQLIPNSQIKHKSKIFRLFGKGQPEQHIILTDRPTTENNNECINQFSYEHDEKSNQFTQQAIRDHGVLAQKLKCVSGLDYFKKQINLILNRSQPLKFNIQIFLNQLCFKKVFKNSQSVQFYNSALDKINEQLDVFNIMIKINEIDKMKEILLTNSQQLLFNFTSKPIISMEEEKEMPFNRTILEERARNTINETLCDEKNKKLKPKKIYKQFKRTVSLDRDMRIYNRIYRAYDTILQQSSEQNPQHDINKKLIKKLGDEIQAIFKLSKLLDFDGLRRLRANSNNDVFCRNTQNLPEELLSLQRVDVFGQIVFLRMNKQAYYRTKIGGGFSIAVLFIMIYFYSQSLSSFFLKEYLKVVSSNQYEDQIQQIKIDDSEFMIAFKIEQHNFTMSPYFNLTLEQKQYRRNQNGSQIKNSINFPLIPCTLDRFQNTFSKYQIDFKEQFNSLGLDDFLCPQYKYIHKVDKTPLSLWEELTQFLTLQISKCENNEKINCASQQKIDEYLKSMGSFKISIYTINQIINPYKQEYRSVFLDDQIYFTFVPNQINRKANIYFKKYEFLNDQSLMPFNDIEEDTVFQIDLTDIKEMSDIGTSTDQLFATFNFQLNPFKTKFVRNYQKIDELLSNLGGIQQAFFFFIGLIIGLYNRIQFLIELANKLFEFQIDSTLQNRQHQENLELIDEFIQHREDHIHGNSNENIDELENQQMEDKLSPNISQRYNLLNLFVNTGGTQTKNTNYSKTCKETKRQQYKMAEKLKLISGLDYFQKQIIKIIERQKPIHLDFLIFCNYISCGRLFKNNPRVILMNKALYFQNIILSENIQVQLDVHHILLKLNELDKLKEIVLNYKQLLMFNFTPKPQISIENNAAQPSRQLIEEIVKGPGIIENDNFMQPSLQGDYLIYSKIFNAYDDILQQIDTVYANKALIQKLGPELQIVFKLSKIIDIQHKIYNKQRNPTRRGARQEDEEDLCVKMFEQQSQ